MIKYLLFLILFYTSSSIEGRWKIISYGAIEKIKSSPAYMYGDEAMRDLIDQQFELILSEGEYIFAYDTLKYTDLEDGDIIYRRAIYLINNDTLFINEIDRDFSRKALILLLNKDSLVLTPIIENSIGSSRLIFERN